VTATIGQDVELGEVALALGGRAAASQSWIARICDPYHAEAGMADERYVISVNAMGSMVIGPFTTEQDAQEWVGHEKAEGSSAEFTIVPLMPPESSPVPMQED
jgi:hypothetical protein